MMRAVYSMQNLTRRQYQFALFSLLVLASVISLILEKLHAHVNGSDNYQNLVFNLFLAWIPFIASMLAYLTKRNRVTFTLMMPVCVLVWLIFFPNAPYLLTDFQHLAYTDGSAPIWFDVLLMIWFAWTGLLLGIASLYLMQELIAETFNPLVGWLFAIGATVLSSIGVYLGRFLRWNSWDLLRDPIPIARDMMAIVRHPISNLPTYIFTALFTLLFLFIYLTIHLFGGVMHKPERKDCPGKEQ